MSLPPLFKTYPEYITEALTFLRNYQWLFSIPNTHILSAKLLDNFPEEWCAVFKNITIEELNCIPFGYLEKNWPQTLQDFITKIESLKPKVHFDYCKYKGVVTHNYPQFFKGLSQKKIHEIVSLAPFIHENCTELNIDLIIDIGAGLGYLSQLLYKEYGYNILAVEENELFVKTAQKRQRDLYNNSLNNVKYIQHFVDPNSNEFLLQAAQEYFPGCSKICLIGLHACADLSISLLRLFTTMSYMNQAIVMPCCYHRMKISSDQNIPNSRGCENRETFENFPVSRVLRVEYGNQQDKFLTAAFLRLACQNTARSWEQMSPENHNTHSVAVMRRAVLQLVADTENCHLRRTKRKTRCLDSTAHGNEFTSYLNELKNSHSLKIHPTDDNELIDSANFRQKMMDSWTAHEKNCQLIEVFSAFQTSLQSICENLVLLDRVEMMKELGYLSFARKITDDVVSPRCFALVARQQ